VVTGLGSIYVNGIEYDTTNATVTDDLGNPASASDLKMGMQVALVGSDPTVASGEGNAGNVTFWSDFEAPVDSADPSTGVITLLGQEVDTNVNTVWDPALTGGISGLTPGELLKIYSLYDTNTGRYVASRVEPDAGATAYKLRGLVSNLDTTAMTYMVGTTEIDYSAVTAPPALANGLVVTAILQTTQGANGWPATALHMQNNGMPGNKVTVHVRGMVSNETNATSFTLEGWPIDASAASFPDGQSVIVNGAMVQVDGTMYNGAVVASTVDIQTPGAHHGLDFQVHGPIDGINQNRQTFVLRGTLVSYSGNVNFTGGNATNLAVGTKVLVQGTLAPDGNTVQAVNIAINQ
jgi:hypothetical protein